MAKSKKVNYNDYKEDQLRKEINEEKNKYYRLEFNHAVSPLANPIEIRNVRRNIARMNTALTAITKQK